MTYLLIDLNIDCPPSAIELSAQQTGVGIVVRRGNRPLGFVMQPLQPGQRLSITEVEQLIAEELGETLLRQSIASELTSQSFVRPVLSSLTLAICTKDHPALLKRCLSSIKAALPTDEPVEILVIDNASIDDRTHQVVEKFTNIRYQYEPKAGLDFARNRALQKATSDFIAFLDDDVVIDRYWFQGFRTALQDHPDAAALTGLILPYELETQAQVLFELAGGFRRGYEQVRYGQVLPGNVLYPCGSGIFGAGANMAFRRETLVELGGFDEALDTGRPLPGGGDLDMFYRIIRSGKVLVYEPSFMVFHQHRRELTQLRRQYWSWGLGLMAYVVKSLKTDPPMRMLFIRLMGWWLEYQLKRVKHRLEGRYPLPLNLILVELWGGIQGLCGSYGRSQRRTRAIINSHKPQSPPPRPAVQPSESY